MADPHRGKRCWCNKCDREVYFRDEWRCRHCDPVERINALAETMMPGSYNTRRGFLSVALNKVAFASFQAQMGLCYIHAADIILENE